MESNFRLISLYAMIYILRVAVGQCLFKNQNDCIQIKDQQSFDKRFSSMRQLVDQTQLLQVLITYYAYPTEENCLAYNRRMIDDYYYLTPDLPSKDDYKKIIEYIFLVKSRCQPHIENLISELNNNINNLSNLQDSLKLEICTNYKNDGNYPESKIWNNYVSLPDYSKLTNLKGTPQHCKSIIKVLEKIEEVYNKIKDIPLNDSSNCLKLIKAFKPLIKLDPMYKSDPTFILIDNKISTCNTNMISCNTLIAYSIEYFPDYLTITRNSKFTFKDENPLILSFVETSYDVTIDALDAGGIYLGYCALDNLKDCTSIKFSGIGITYFGEECYHIDFFKDNEYEITGRHCLDSEDLKQTEIKITDKKLEITEKSIIHQYTYYSKDLSGTNFQACILMMKLNAKIIIKSPTY